MSSNDFHPPLFGPASSSSSSSLQRIASQNSLAGSLPPDSIDLGDIFDGNIHVFLYVDARVFNIRKRLSLTFFLPCFFPWYFQMTFSPMISTSPRFSKIWRLGLLDWRIWSQRIAMKIHNFIIHVFRTRHRYLHREIQWIKWLKSHFLFGCQK